MAQFNVHEAENRLAHLLELAEQGEEVIVVRHGKPVARLVPIAQPSILGIGTGDPNYRSGLSDEEAFSPLTEEEAAAFYEGRG